MLRKSKVATIWNSSLAYVIGIIAADGNLSPDLRHIVITSKDEEMVLNCKKCLNITNKIGKKARGGSTEKNYFVLQFGDVNFFYFLTEIGLVPKKSLILKKVDIPDPFYRDFVRGYIDGDGNISISKHPESNNPQLKIRICSGSKDFLFWLQKNNIKHFGISNGSICKYKNSSAYMLCYGKADGQKLLKQVYYANSVALTRKRDLALKALG
jgi:hypothetical protein